jgi:carbonic anhydrase/acetyltransferase-like protein (isoleucine patch superfamily)
VIHPSAFIAPGAMVLGDVTLGLDASIWYNCVVRADMAPIVIGEETNIQDLTMVHVDEDVPCTIGRRVGVGHRAILHGCTIGDGALVGMGAVLLNGVRVGAGAVIAAGAVLPEGLEVPPGMLVLGVPGRVARPVSEELAARARRTWEHYVAEARRHRAGEVPRHPVSRLQRL